MKYYIIAAVTTTVVLAMAFVDTMIAIAASHIFGIDFIYSLVYIMFATLVTTVTLPGISEATHRYMNSRQFIDYIARLRSTNNGAEDHRVPASRPVATPYPRGGQSGGDTPVPRE